LIEGELKLVSNWILGLNFRFVDRLPKMTSSWEIRFLEHLIDNHEEDLSMLAATNWEVDDWLHDDFFIALLVLALLFSCNLNNIFIIQSANLLD